MRWLEHAVFRLNQTPVVIASEAWRSRDRGVSRLRRQRDDSRLAGETSIAGLLRSARNDGSAYLQIALGGGEPSRCEIHRWRGLALAVIFQKVVHSVRSGKAEVVEASAIREGRPNEQSQECASDAERSRSDGPGRFG
jgi:hypothetical protein